MDVLLDETHARQVKDAYDQLGKRGLFDKNLEDVEFAMGDDAEKVCWKPLSLFSNTNLTYASPFRRCLVSREQKVASALQPGTFGPTNS